MKIYYDTEFLENGRTIDLISIGMVREDGEELYCIADEIREGDLYDRIRNNPWLMGNVIPHLPLRAREGYTQSVGVNTGHFHLDDTDNRIMPRRMIRNAVRAFVLGTRSPELWAWYGAYDHVVLAQLFGKMIDLPEGFPMWTNDLKQECHRLGGPPLPKQESAEHDALADARWVRDAHRSLLVGAKLQ